jgi:lipoyl(octanoyl) transferase
MDLAPFRVIDPCGYPDLDVTQLRDLGIAEPLESLRERLLSKLTQRLDTTAEHA